MDDIFDSKWQALKYSILSGVCEPIGALVFGAFFTPYMTDATVQSLLAAGFNFINKNIHSKDK
jgi:zinc transporter ZupT